MANDFNIPIWKNVGQEPSAELLQSGYAELDVPASAHFNYLMNRVTTGLSEVYSNSINKEGGVLNIGIPTPNSESKLRWVSLLGVNASVVEQDSGWYSVVSKKEGNMTLRLSGTAWATDLPAYDANTAEFSLVFSVRAPSDKSVVVNTTNISTGTTILSKSVTSSSEVVSATQVSEHLVRIIFKHNPVGNSDLSVNIDIVLAGLTKLNDSVVISKPTTIYGNFYTGASVSNSSYYKFSTDAFRYVDQKVTDVGSTTNSLYGTYPIELTVDKYGAKAGVGTISTFSTGTGISNLVSSIMFLRDSLNRHRMYMSLYAVDSAPVFEEVITDNSLVTDYLSKYYTASEVNTMLNGYADVAYLGNYVTKVSTANWQKTKITNDDGTPRINLDSHATTQEKINALKTVRSMVSIKGDLLSFLLGDSQLTTNIFIRGYRLDELFFSYTAPLQGHANLGNSSNQVIVEVTGAVYDDYATGTFYPEDMIRLQIVYDFTNATPVITINQYYDEQTSASKFTSIVTDYTSTVLDTTRYATEGEHLFSGSLQTANQTITLSDELWDYDLLRVEYTRSSTRMVDYVPIATIRNDSVLTFSVQAMFIDDALTNVWAYELAVRSPDSFVGDQLTVQHNNRFNIITKATATNANNLIITNIYGIKF